MGMLKCGVVDFNDTRQVQALQAAVREVLDDQRSYYPLAHTKKYYFSTPTAALPDEPGWYIILQGTVPLYVGRAEDLNRRLNSENGSRDHFANPRRTSDSERNFVKKYAELGLLSNLRVCVVRERLLGLPTLGELDRGNIEKHLNIWRCFFRYR